MTARVPGELLLLLTPPNCGSTSMAAFIAQSPQVGGLQHRFEGQWLVDDLCAEDRWDETKRCDFEAIGTVWRDSAAKKMRKHPEIRYFVEKSPPNMMRYRDIVSLFQRSRVVIGNRNPFANISSVGYRKHDFDRLDRVGRLEQVESLAELWLRFARRLNRIAQQERYPVIRYEDFCEDPARVFRVFDLSADLAKQTDPAYPVKVKDHPAQPVRNMNPEQVSRLSTEELERIGKTLSTDADVVRFFGYEIRPG